MEKKLPPEIITDILSRLPIESVLECKLVCKTWRYLIYDRAFVHLHLRRSLQLHNEDNQKCQRKDESSAAVATTISKVSFILIVCLEKDDIIYSDEYNQEYDMTDSNDGLSGIFLYYTEYNEDDYDSYKKIRRINHPALTEKLYSLVGSCNGLICLSVAHDKLFIQDPVYICNPITREFVNLPSLNITNDENRFGVKTASGFGYDASTDEYKVVRIYYLSKQPSVGHVEVYTLGGGNTNGSKGGRRRWRDKGEIQYSLVLGNSATSPGIFSNGALHWLDVEDLKIVVFDLAEEEFYLLPSPPCLISDKSNCFELQVLGGCLCVVHKKKHEFLDIWLLQKTKNNCHQFHIEKQDYQSCSWSREVRMPWDYMFNVGSCKPIVFTESGEYVLWCDHCNVISYDKKTATMSMLYDHGLIPCLEASIHINSFVSLKVLGEEAKIIGSVEVDESEEINFKY